MTADDVVASGGSNRTITLSPDLELVSPPYVYYSGRCFHVGPEVSELLSRLAGEQKAPSPSGGTVGPDQPSSSALDQTILSELILYGFVQVGEPPIRRLTPRDPLSIHVRYYSRTLLRLLILLGKMSPARYVNCSAVLVAAGLVCLVASGGSFRPHQLAWTISQWPWYGMLLFVGSGISVLVWHEAGHVGACLRAGRQVTRAGIGVYVTRLVFFVDLVCMTDTRGRERRHADLSGLANEALIFLVLQGAARWGLLRADIGAVISAAFMASILFALNPWVKSDGYWLLRDTFDCKFDPAAWISHPRAYLHRISGVAGGPAETRLCRVHLLSGSAWLIVTTSWLVWISWGFAVAAHQGGTAVIGWIVNFGSAAITLIGLAAVVRALIRRKTDG